MDYRQPLIALLLAVSGSASAAYAQLVPPSTWTPIPPPGMGTVTTGNFYSAPANGAWSGTLSRTTATMNIGGRQIAVPVTMKLAPTAGRVAAAAIFLSPQLRAAAGIASWLGVAGVVWDAVNNRWASGSKEAQVSDGLLFMGQTGEWSDTSSDACQSFKDYFSNAFPSPPYTMTGGNVVKNGDVYTCKLNRLNDGVYDLNYDRVLQTKGSTCPVGWYITPAGCVQTPPIKQVTQQEMIDLLNPDNTPGWPSPTVPGEFPPHTPFPVEPPIINPDTGVNPFPKPLFIPTGDPVPNPRYNPDASPGPGNQPWKQPGATITPRPTASEPWRVDVQPTDREQPGPDPRPDSEYNPDPDPNDKPKPEEQQSLCEKHPEILACQTLKDSGDKPDALKTQAAEFEFTPESGFSGAASCPPPIVVNASGMNLSFSWQPFCNSLGLAKPIILAFAWLSAAFIMLGARQT